MDDFTAGPSGTYSHSPRQFNFGSTGPWQEKDVINTRWDGKHLRDSGWKFAKETVNPERAAADVINLLVTSMSQAEALSPA
ncbi:hypothetical protein RRG08_042374 [Elysia crispata]|uniref:Uncharacterized protein n=1 Tax=Elysia crispata TaxID=231223 RepID=A0AAE0ZBU5_9GAST|nr:hypothetical protein RRG08_042374 [Elysia crispata]